MTELLAMSTGVRVALQVAVSLLMVVAVIAFMWRLPRKGDQFGAWAPSLALVSAWSGLFSALSTIALWFVATPDRWLPAVFLVLYPGALATGTLVHWIHRGRDSEPSDEPDPVVLQRTQAWVGIVLGMAAVVGGYVFVMTHKTPFTPIGE